MKPYTVKIPSQWVEINSARAQAYLRDYFIHPLTLPADPGPGEHAVCLTLSEKLVSKLAEGAGERPAVALRRLLAARIRELPAVSLPAPESRSIVLARPKVSEVKPKPRTGLLDPPAWFDPQNSNRLSYWRSLGTDYQLQMIEAHRASEGKDRGWKMDTQKKTGQQFSAFERAVFWTVDHWGLLVIVGVVLVLLGRRLGWFATARATSAAASVPWPAWVPR